MPPETRYARSGDVNIAYQVVGDGPLDLVLFPGWVPNVEIAGEEPLMARFLHCLAAFSRLIIFDKRGTGLSESPVASLTGSSRASDQPPAPGAVVPPTMSQSELAAELGATRVSLNRALKGFRRLGAIAVERKRVVLLEAGILANFVVA